MMDLALKMTGRMLLYGILYLPATQPFTPPRSVSSQRSYTLQRTAHNLNTAFEWLADERENIQPAYSCLTWLDASEILPQETSVDNEGGVEMPLYPIGATYLPSKTTHFLNNMEPRNVQMALDLGRLPMDRKFCVVLSCADTGRIASVGTIMEVMDIEVQRVEKDMIRKIRVTSRPTATVNIQSIINPQAASWESQIRKSPDYLKAWVAYRDDLMDFASNHEIVKSILEDYNVARSLYLNGVGSRNFPSYARDNLKESLPAWTSANFETENSFWFSLEQWQTLCNTIRDQHQSILSTDRNELMIAAASAKGGPLQLPIHPHDLTPDVRRELQDMEVKAQKDFVKMDMDPCLDFQVLLSLPNYTEKLRFFSGMISRERLKLENLLSQGPAPNAVRMVPEPPRRGAWFDDSAWEIPAESEPTPEMADMDMAVNGTQYK